MSRNNLETGQVSRLLIRVGFLICLASSVAFGPAGADPAPSDLQRVPRAGVWTAPAVDVERLLAEDLARGDDKEVPFRVALPISTDLTPGNSGSWRDRPGGGQVWRLEVRSPDARWLVLGFESFRLEPGGVLEAFDREGRTVLGPLTADDVREDGQLWLPPVAGDTVLLELRWPEELRGVEPALRLGTVSHGYKEFFGGDGARDLDRASPAGESATRGPGGSGSCNVDVNCPLGAGWQDEKRGVVFMFIGNSGVICSGSLVNNTANDCRPYLLTANHCFTATNPVGVAASAFFTFNLERPACGSGTPAGGEVLSGATQRATSTNSDFMLLELLDDPPPEFDAYFNGWSRSTTPATEAWTIHHPSGDYKKISHDEGPVVTSPGGDGAGASYWRVNNWEEGTTEGGSSGGPLFDQNHRIVGQLLGGTASCTSLTWDEFGKFGISWNVGVTPSARLRDWLDPGGTNVTTLDGIDRTECPVDCTSDADCDDEVDCTADTCDTGTGDCTNAPNDALCDDDDVCTLDTCDVGSGGCLFEPAPDADGDGICDAADNCPGVSNPGQEDFDGDGIADACETGVTLADADNSGRVDGFDLALLARAFGTSGAPPSSDPRYDATVDFDRDLDVDGNDLALLAGSFGQSVP